MATPLENLAELIETLRELGVLYYEVPGLTLQLAPESRENGSTNQQALASAAERNDADREPARVGYRHPSLGLFSWPESKEILK